MKKNKSGASSSVPSENSSDVALPVDLNAMEKEQRTPPSSPTESARRLLAFLQDTPEKPK